MATLFWTALGGVVTLLVGLAADSFVRGLFERWAALGWLGVALLGLLGLVLAALALRELAGISRLRRIDRIRSDAEAGVAGARDQADAALEGLASLYAGRGAMAAAVADLKAARDDTPDRGELLGIAERRLMAPLDRRAERTVAGSARMIAGATAIIPMAVLDVVMVLVINLRMIRQVAEIYGGRAGWLGSWRLLRSVATHLLASGAVAATDDLVGPVIGHGIVGRLSRRFGEAAVNGALTARVGAAAIEVCRPLPFTVRTAPRARHLLATALSDWRSGEDKPG
jgi:putative membrane protein